MKIRTTLLAYVLAASVGCSSAQIAADETAAYNALVKVEQGIDWVNANATLVNSALDEAAAADPNNATLQAAVAKAKAANTAGNRALALQIVQGGKTVLAPVATPK